MKKDYIVAKDISRWKLDNKFENFLSHKADKSELWKKIYVFYYKVFDYKYYKKGKKFIEEEIKKQRPNIKSLYPLSDKYLTRDMIYSLHRFGASFNDYFLYKFYNLNYIGREQFNTLKLQYGFCSILNSNTVRELCEDKINTFNKFKKYYKRDVLEINDISEISKISGFISKHTNVILKPLRGHSGHGIRILESANFDNFLISKYLKLDGVILEELIIQDDRMAILNSSSINTIRINTYNNNGIIKIFGACLRMGRKDSIVDNAGSGGIYALIDHENGVVVKRANDILSNTFTYHPDSKIKIPGFEIPDWEKALTIVKEMAALIPEGKLLAWDLALSINGWCLVEINDIGDPYLLQISEINGNKDFILNSLKNLYDTV